MPPTPVLSVFDPDAYLDGPPHSRFADLRREEPVSWQEVPGAEGCWAVLRHADVVEVARHPQVFSASAGGIVLDDLDPQALASSRLMLLAMDPPTHTDYRRPIAPTFKARVIAAMEGQIRDICRRAFADAAEKGTVEFVHDVTAQLPSRVVASLMGLPDADIAYLHHLAEQTTTTQDPDYVGDVDEFRNAGEMAVYGMQFAARRRQEAPRDDLTSLLLETEFGGTRMDDVAFGTFFVQVVTAGNDTTKTMLSSGMLCLLERPDQLAALRDDASLIPGAVEEILRFANPLHYFRRTATEATTLGGQRIAAGDKVAMIYTSANRDEGVFDDPQRFDIHRNPNPHLSFGIATHFCLGVHLARLEGRVFFEELLRTFRSIELAGAPVRARSNLNNAYKSLPVTLTPA
jgi:cytochrome P450